MTAQPSDLGVPAGASRPARQESQPLRAWQRQALAAYVRERTRQDASPEPPVDVREIMKILNESLSERNES